MRRGWQGLPVYKLRCGAVLGGLSHFEPTMQDGAGSVLLQCKIAEKRGRMVGLHRDESDDPLSRYGKC